MHLSEGIKRIDAALAVFEREVIPGKQPWEAPEGPLLQMAFYTELKNVLIFEANHQELVKDSKKEVLKHMENIPPGHSLVDNQDYFQYMYSRFSPVRFAVETMTSIEEYSVIKRGEYGLTL
jgi:hypothetical protein